MSWKERFHDLSESRRKAMKEFKEKEKQRIAEFQKIDKIYRSQIERVCLGFIKAVSWPYFRTSVGSEARYFRLIGSSYGRENEYGDSIEVTLHKSGIFIGGRHSGFDGSWEKKQEMPFDEFTEDRFGQILEEILKEK